MPLVLGQHVDHSYYGLDHRFEVLPAPTLPVLQRLLEFRRGCEAKGGMRMGRDVPSRAIAAVLSQTMILEPLAGWDDAIIRYAGFGTAKFFGRDVTGLRHSEIQKGDRSGTLGELFAEARGIVAENRCRVLDHRALNGGITIGHQEVVTFPILAPDGGSRWLFNAAFDL